MAKITLHIYFKIGIILLYLSIPVFLIRFMQGNMSDGSTVYIVLFYTRVLLSHIITANHMISFFVLPGRFDLVTTLLCAVAAATSLIQCPWKRLFQLGTGQVVPKTVPTFSTETYLDNGIFSKRDYQGRQRWHS